MTQTISSDRFPCLCCARCDISSQRSRRPSLAQDIGFGRNFARRYERCRHRDRRIGGASGCRRARRKSSARTRRRQPGRAQLWNCSQNGNRRRSPNPRHARSGYADLLGAAVRSGGDGNSSGLPSFRHRALEECARDRGQAHRRTERSFGSRPRPVQAVSSVTHTCCRRWSISASSCVSEPPTCGPSSIPPIAFAPTWIISRAAGGKPARACCTSPPGTTWSPIPPRTSI